ncbi:hypothetical protein [Candidatus Nitrosacidococcus sp. I8]|uniref:hypothetical protein n=1 Tax=Candidatus Nitrosacidococcus sp. I8 TaxID=2942908 RepID=UPI002226A13C|nr:hypothetical protein [Candidatus Nitrosacidococcus sp. I8]CAH9018690.1 hypothetical protein NURINAE_01075 [Candidatus Nitrosacidococcus sp. I8]
MLNLSKILSLGIADYFQYMFSSNSSHCQNTTLAQYELALSISAAPDDPRINIPQNNTIKCS